MVKNLKVIKNLYNRTKKRCRSPEEEFTNLLNVSENISCK